MADAATVALAGAVKDTTTLLREEVHTLRVSVNGLRTELGKADEQMKHMLRRTGLRFAGAGMAIVFALVVLGASAGAGMLAWNSRLIDKALAQKQALNKEIAALQTLQGQWASAESAGKMTRCGEAPRPCVRIDPSTSFRDNSGHLYQFIDAANP